MMITERRTRFALLAAAAAVYLVGLWPSWWLRISVMRAAGFPPYAGLWKLLPHLLLYSTLAAACAAIAWIAFARAGVLEPMPLGKGRRAWTIAAVGGLAGIALTLAFFVVTGQSAALGWKPPDPWSIAGNLASNFYEEFIYRGFLLAALTAVIRFWPAAVVTSALWAATHTQYPVSLQLLIFVVGVLLAWMMREARTLWAPWGAHMIMDVVLDSLLL